MTCRWGFKSPRPQISFSKMECETCGRYIERGKKVKLEGSIVITCDECAAYGEVIDEVTIQKKDKAQRDEKKVNELFDIEFSDEERLIENFGNIIKNAREKANMKQEDLAKKINQPKSLIQRIETGKFKPSVGLAKKLEKILNVKLVENSEEEKENKMVKTLSTVEKSKDITLGDLVVIRKKEK